MDSKALFCVGWHYKIWCEDIMNKRETRFTRPCETCPKSHTDECADTNWHEAAVQLHKETGISVDCLRQPCDPYTADI